MGNTTNDQEHKGDSNCQGETTDEQQATDKKKKKVTQHKKRGPPRPHRKLDTDVLNGRIEKLNKRITRAKQQLEDAQRHIEGYNKEFLFRQQDA